MRTLESIIADAISSAAVEVKADIDAMEASCAALIARRDALQAELDSVSGQIEKATSEIKEAQELMQGLRVECKAAESKIVGIKREG